MEYTELSVEDRREILRGRILQYEADHFRVAQDVAALEATEIEGKQEQIDVKEANLAHLESIVASDRAALESLSD